MADFNIDGDELMWDATRCDPVQVLQDMVAKGCASLEQLENAVAVLRDAQTNDTYAWVLASGHSGYKDTGLAGDVHGVFQSQAQGQKAMAILVEQREEHVEVMNIGPNCSHVSEEAGSRYRAEWTTYTLKRCIYKRKEGSTGNVHVVVCQSSCRSNRDYAWVNHVTVGVFDTKGEAKKFLDNVYVTNRWYSFDGDNEENCFISNGMYESTVE